jgi:hypothetical protein
VTIAELYWREDGTELDGYRAAATRWPDVLRCLVCRHLVNPFGPHWLLRDAAQHGADLDDPDATVLGIVGLLHPGDCKTLYLLDAELSGATIQEDTR